MIRPEAVRRLILARLAPLPPRRMALADAHGLVLADPLRAGCNLPRFSNAAMDGFAVRAADTVQPPVVLRVVGCSLPGAPCGLPVGQGEAISIATGAELPDGADAIVPVELVTRTEDEITVAISLGAGKHVRREGEDVTAGQVVIEAGTVIGPGQLVAAAALGVEEVVVHPRPRVAIVPTGDEVRPAGSSLGRAEIYDAVSAALEALVLEAGGRPRLQPITRDDPAALIRTLGAAAMEADAVVTVGAVSAGERDFIRRLGGPVRLQPFQVALRPARPFAFGTAFDKPLFALPGNPASALAAFEEFVRPAIRSMMGKPPFPWPALRATLSEPLAVERGYLHLVRAHVWLEDARLFVRSGGRQGAGMVHSLAGANAWAVIPADVGALPAGSEVDVRMLGEPSTVAPDPPVTSRMRSGPE
jgi:molybdopterin molybdotransferase